MGTREDELRRQMEKDFGSVAKFARSVNLPPTTVYNVLNRGISGASLETADKILSGLGLNWAGSPTGDHEFSRPLPKGAMPIVSGGHATVPLRTLGSVHAGDLTDEETDDGTVEVPSSVADAHPHAFALTVEGDCMDRVVPAGCHVMVDPDVEPRDGSIAVVETQDYQAVMRRWFRGSTTLLLRADSFEAHDDIVMTGDDPVRVVGTVVWFQSSVQMV